MEYAHQTTASQARKIFFLNPSFSIRTRVIEPLKLQEYEVHCITDYRRAKGYIRTHNGAFLYINPESQLTVAPWIAFVQSIAQNPLLQSTTVGILCESLSSADEEAFAATECFSGGIFSCDGEYASTLQELSAQLTHMGAKGKRQYVRASCAQDPGARFLWIQNDRMFQAKLIDISVASIAILVSAQIMPFLNTHTEIFVTLQLNARQVQVKAKSIIIKRRTAETYAAIFLITENTTEDSISLIRNYVFDTLDREVQTAVQDIELDKTDYHSCI